MSNKSSAANNSLQLQTSQLVTVENPATSHPVDSLATNNLLCREFNYKPSHCVEVQLQTIHLVLESSATIAHTYREFSYIRTHRVQLKTSHLLESAAANNLPCRNFSYKQIRDLGACQPVRENSCNNFHSVLIFLCMIFRSQV